MTRLWLSGEMVSRQGAKAQRGWAAPQAFFDNPELAPCLGVESTAALPEERHLRAFASSAPLRESSSFSGRKDHGPICPAREGGLTAATSAMARVRAGFDRAATFSPTVAITFTRDELRAIERALHHETRREKKL